MTHAFPPTGRREGRWASALWVALLGLVLIGLTVLCFWRWTPKLFFGDDLDVYVQYVGGAFASNPLQDLTQSASEKFRPVFALVMNLLCWAFGTKIKLYMGFNVALNALSGLVMARLAYRMSAGSRLIAVLAAAMSVCCRFMLYQVTQVTGILEGVGYLWFLVVVSAVLELHSLDTAQRRRIVGLTTIAVVAEWLLVFTHERYLPAVPWVAAMLSLSPSFRRLRWTEQALALGAGVAAAIVDVGYKALFLKEALLVGTGGSYIHIDLRGEVDRLTQAILSVLNINYGPEYLVGWSMLGRPFTPVDAVAILSIIILAVLAVLGSAAALSRSGASSPLGWLRANLVPLSLAALAGLLLVPPVMTIRMEQRWLVEPFALVVLAAACWAGRLAQRKVLAASLFSGLAAATLFVDARINSTFSNVYMVDAAKAAVSIESNIVQAGVSLDGLTIVAGPTVCSWVLLDGRFFDIYAPGQRPPACVSDVNLIDSKVYEKRPRPKIYYVDRFNAAHDVSQIAYSQLEARDEPTRFDFLKAFGAGHINDNAQVQTPTGKGALILPVDVEIGIAPTMVVISGFSYRFDHLAIRPGDRLKFNDFMVYSTQQPARAVVRIVGASGAAKTVYSVVLPTRLPQGRLRPQTGDIPLDGFGKEISVSFGAEATGANSSGQWVAFNQPRIAGVAPK